MTDYLLAQKLFWNIFMCGSEYFNGRLVNKKDCIKIHGHDRSPKEGTTCQVFKYVLQIDSHFFQSDL